MLNPFSDAQELEVLTIIGILTKKYGPSWISWEVETIRMELLSDFGEDCSEISFQKVCAAQCALAHSMCWKEWEVFEKVCAACNHKFPIFSFTQPPEPEEILITMYTLNQIADHEYSMEVKKYITAACLNDGLLYLDGPLSICQSEIEKYYDENGFVIDKLDIEKKLKDAPYRETNTYSEIQANRVLNCRNTLRDFHREIEREKKLFKHLLE